MAETVEKTTKKLSFRNECCSIPFFLGIAFAVILLDQLAKYLILFWEPNYDFGFFALTVVKNTGAGFGILRGKTAELALISALAAIATIYFYPKIEQKKLPQVLFALFLGGIIGNLFDRIFHGYVVDFLYFKVWPAFNLADACLTASVIGLIIYYWEKSKVTN